MLGKLTLLAITLAAAISVIVIASFAAFEKFVAGVSVVTIETTIELALTTFVLFGCILLYGFLSVSELSSGIKREARTKRRSVGGNEGFIDNTCDEIDTRTSSEPVGIYRDSEQDPRYSTCELVLPNGE